ncbi:MAG: glucans biosynthesis glucosyltransferase MdoH [Sphingomonas fennica]
MADRRAALPAEAPLDMPLQVFGGTPPATIQVLTSPTDVASRRILLGLLTLILAIAATLVVKESLQRDGFDLWDVLLLLLFLPLFGWIAFGFMTSAIGFVLLTFTRHQGFVRAAPPAEPLVGRTAVLVPIHNEDVASVFDRIAAMMESVERAGGTPWFDFFVLSDSAPTAEPEERAAWEALALAAPGALYYRRREKNVGRKPGNIADWVRRFGAAYDYMLVLDADSLMSGTAMMGMASALDRRPSVGLFQTVPTITGAVTFFQRWMQFASRLYGPIASTGLLWWSGSEATFWGHNAMLRTRAFAESCGLPDLPGRPPFGGMIMSHDMVEAALLRRRGWATHMALIEESHEEFPPTMIDMAIRDRRWAQGNIQHVRLLASSGFHWISRLHLLIGASAYITSPMWLLLILVTVGQALATRGLMGGGAPPVMLLVVTVVLLFGPKAMAVAWAWARADRRAGFGGARAIARSVAADVPLAMLLAPATMLTQTLDLISILRGKPSGWHPQERDRDHLSFAEVWPRYRWHLALGAALLALVPVVPMTGLWLLPITIGLIVSPWLAMWTASRALGRRTAARGLFHVPPAGAFGPLAG